MNLERTLPSSTTARRLFYPAFRAGDFDSAAAALRHAGLGQTVVDDLIAEAIEQSKFGAATTIFANLSFELTAVVERDHAADCWQLWLALLSALSMTPAECRQKIRKLESTGFRGPWRVVTPWPYRRH